MEDVWAVWRLVAVEKVATLQEIDTHWTLEDVLHANIALDAVAEAERQQAEQAKRRKG